MRIGNTVYTFADVLRIYKPVSINDLAVYSDYSNYGIVVVKTQDNKFRVYYACKRLNQFYDFDLLLDDEFDYAEFLPDDQISDLPDDLFKGFVVVQKIETYSQIWKAFIINYTFYRNNIYVQPKEILNLQVPDYIAVNTKIKPARLILRGSNIKLADLL